MSYREKENYSKLCNYTNRNHVRMTIHCHESVFLPETHVAIKILVDYWYKQKIYLQQREAQSILFGEFASSALATQKSCLLQAQKKTPVQPKVMIDQKFIFFDGMPATQKDIPKITQNLNADKKESNLQRWRQ